VEYTPGHASHHVSYFDASEGIAFVGDTTGIRIDNGPYILPATPPPDISLEIWDNSFATILARRPSRLFLTHFGFAGNPAEHIEEFRRHLHHWARLAAETLRSASSEADAKKAFVARAQAEMQKQIGTEEAFAVLEHALVGGNASRDTILQQLIGLRDDKAIPLLCYVLSHTSPRRNMVSVHAQIIEALGNLAAHQDSTRMLRTILWRGEWWAPFRTAALRQAAAAALRQIGAPETIAVLQEAVARGSRGVRSAARRYLPSSAREAT